MKNKSLVKKAYNDFLVSQADLLNRKLQDQVDNAKELNKLRKNLLKGMVDEVDNLDQQRTLLADYEEKMRRTCGW